MPIRFAKYIDVNDADVFTEVGTLLYLAWDKPHYLSKQFKSSVALIHMTLCGPHCFNICQSCTTIGAISEIDQAQGLSPHRQLRLYMTGQSTELCQVFPFSQIKYE